MNMSFNEISIDYPLDRSAITRFKQVNLLYTSPVSEGLAQIRGNPWNPKNIFDSITQEFKQPPFVRQTTCSKYKYYKKQGYILNILYTSRSGKFLRKYINLC